MKTIISGALALATAATLVAAHHRPAQPPSAAQTQPAAQKPAARQTVAPSGAVDRGEYLVNSVAMCVQCHSPRMDDGRIVEERKLTGAPMPVRGPAWNDEWAFQAPAIAGPPGFTDDQIVMLLTRGRAGPDRDPPTPPMPPFRMTKEDAQAVVAYLRSLR